MRGLAPRCPTPDAGSFAGYTKARRLGQGAFGTVYLMKNDAAGSTRVLKEIKLHGLRPKDVEETLSEVAILKRCEHPNIIRFHGSTIKNNTLCILMEHAGGGDLAKLIETHARSSRPLPEERVACLIAEIASALNYCHHELHTLHRDLKPANILLSSDGHVKLCDFGISKVLCASAALASTQVGTPLYMSPELCAGRSYDRASDVWSLGCVLYELMSLKPPWSDHLGAHGAAGGISALLKRISASTLSLPSKVTSHYSGELGSLASALLARNPADRMPLSTMLQMPMIERALPAPHTTTAAAPLTTGGASGATTGAEKLAAAPPRRPSRPPPLSPLIESPPDQKNAPSAGQGWDKPPASRADGPRVVQSRAQKQPLPMRGHIQQRSRQQHGPPAAMAGKPSRPPSAPAKPVTKQVSNALRGPPLVRPPSSARIRASRPSTAAASKPETLLQQQRRLAAAAGGILRPTTRVPFQPLLRQC